MQTFIKNKKITQSLSQRYDKRKRKQKIETKYILALVVRIKNKQRNYININGGT